MGLGEASTALWMSREKFSAPTTEERYEERCILRQGRLSVDGRSEKYLEVIGRLGRLQRMFWVSSVLRGGQIKQPRTCSDLGKLPLQKVFRSRDVVGVAVSKLG